MLATMPIKRMVTRGFLLASLCVAATPACQDGTDFPDRDLSKLVTESRAIYWLNDSELRTNKNQRENRDRFHKGSKPGAVPDPKELRRVQNPY